MSESLLVTGGTGFIGSVLVDRLSRLGYSGVVLDLWPPDSLPANWEFVRADVRDSDAVLQCAEGCSGIFHLAAAHHDDKISEATYFSVNEAGTRAVCAAAEAHAIERICFLSSVAVYGDSPFAKDEETIPAPGSPYGASKLAAEAVLRGWTAAGSNRRAIVLRPTAVLGPNSFGNPFRLCAYLDRRVFVSVGDGRNQKSLAYVDNLVAASIALWGQDAGPGIQIYNYADKPDLSSAEIMTEIRLAHGRTPRGLRVPAWLARLGAFPVEIAGRVLRRDLRISRNRIRKLAELNSVVHADKIRNAGVVPEVTLSEGLRRMVAWYRAEGSALTPVNRRPPEEIVRSAPVSLATPDR